MSNYSQSPSDGSPYEKRIDARGRVLSDECIADEVPFDELPEGWAWARLESALVNRDSERIPVSVTDRKRLAKTYDYYGASGVIDKVDRYLFDKPLLLIGEDGANLLARSKPIAFLARGKYWVNNHAHVLDGINERYLEYIALFINSISLAPYVTGTAQPKMNQAKMGLIVIPIPPESEQDRILAKVDQLMPLVEEYGELEDTREKLDAALPDRLRKSVLQMAVQGKLVTQEPADEPASVLLQRIRKERAKLVAEGKAKFPKGGESIICTGSDGRHYEKRIDAKGRVLSDECIEDEIPFEIPDSWEWVRLGALGAIVGGGTPKTEKTEYWADETSGIPWITPADMSNQSSILVSVGNRFISNCGLEKSSAQLLPTGSVLMSSRAPIGYLGIAANPIATNQGFKSVALIDISLNYWLVCALEALMDSIIKRASGTTFKEISGTEFGNTLIPIPPLAEQHRIAKRVAELVNILG